MKKSLLILFIFSFSILSGEGLADKVRSSLKMNFGDDISVRYNKFKLSSEIKSKAEKAVQQKFLQNFVHLFTAVKGDSVVGYGLVDNVYGKLKPITFLVIFNAGGKIIDSEILKYREPYGGAVQNKDWLNQFSEKDKDFGFIYGREIHGISGATISAKSITKGIHKLSLIIDSVIKWK